MQTCGKCAYGQFMPSNVQQRMCFGSPPQVLIFPANKKEGFEVRACRPVVGAGDRACANFKEGSGVFEVPSEQATQ